MSVLAPLVKHVRGPRSRLLHPDPAVSRHAVEGPARRGPNGTGAAGVRRAFIGSACAGPSMIRRCRTRRTPRKDYTDVLHSHQHQLDGRPADPEGHQQGHGEGPERDLHRPQGRDRQGQQLVLVDRLDHELRRRLLQEARRVADLRLGAGRRRPHRGRADRRPPQADPGPRSSRRRTRTPTSSSCTPTSTRCRHDHLDRRVGAVQRHQPGQHQPHGRDDHRLGHARSAGAL